MYEICTKRFRTRIMMMQVGGPNKISSESKSFLWFLQNLNGHRPPFWPSSNILRSSNVPMFCNRNFVWLVSVCSVWLLLLWSTACPLYKRSKFGEFARVSWSSWHPNRWSTLVSTLDLHCTYTAVASAMWIALWCSVQTVFPTNRSSD